MKKYSIYLSKTGELVATIEASEVIIEALSSNNAEGHFQASLVAGLSDFGKHSVYAMPVSPEQS